MKHFSPFFILTVVVVAAACNSGAPTIGIVIDAGTGGGGGDTGSGGTGGGGGVADGNCTNTEDQGVYAGLSYTNESDVAFTGADAAAQIAGDCVFGTTSSIPALPGCGDEAIAVLACMSNCDEIIAGLATCVEECQNDAINEVTGMSLSADCQVCYGATVACGAAFCAFMGCADPASQACIDCQCRFNCSQDFDTCSGLPSTGDCD
jgi:hypothetical protein